MKLTSGANIIPYHTINV